MSPFEVLFGSPAQTGAETQMRTTLPMHLMEHEMINYCLNLSKLLLKNHQAVKAALPSPAVQPLHNLKLGDWVLVKELRRKHWKSKCWLGPFQVLLVTNTTVKVAERVSWVHVSHWKRFTAVPPEGHPKPSAKEVAELQPPVE